MKIHTVNNNLAKILSPKPIFAAQKQNTGAIPPVINEKIRRDTLQLSGSAKKEDPDEYWTARIYADGRIDDPMADYSRSQGDYLRDAVFGILNLDSADDVYDECIAKGMTEEEAGRVRSEKQKELFGNYQEALALALEFVPRNENAAGESISYSDVYDENGQLKVPAKVTPEEYRNNLQSILEKMMASLKNRKEEFSDLYQIYFGE